MRGPINNRPILGTLAETEPIRDSFSKFRRMF